MTGPKVWTFSCPCCGGRFTACKKICQTFRWYRCCICHHWQLDMPARTNQAYQQGYHDHKPLPKDQGAPRARAKQIAAAFPWIKSVADVGCGNGDFLRALDWVPRRTGIDFDRSIKAACQALDIEFIGRDFLDNNLRGRWDLVTAWHVLEHVPQLRRAMERLITLVKPNGILALEIPVDRHLDIVQYHGHIHRFDPDSVAHLLYSFREDLEYKAVGCGLLWPAVAVIARRKPSSVSLNWLKKQCQRGAKERRQGRKRKPGRLG